ncbi:MULTISPECIES: putative bifunctional diguanylate cyclase/phosphodiesterase [Catenuloplanes]|uniref:Diguanylate cyclase (GGDEF)-like protein n=1 Tax=Catenuloplanes niger TaxID=587534 RepID=A0AAE3ZWV7_9ACTN|nr:bifunctional diguanylate cyclase/phosphodiesterase [Catenuloplanes niger]MDR7325583.1 diguanylate cyclase (GGDEF)-like protein [Catenuloplanes niger]
MTSTRLATAMLPLGDAAPTRPRTRFGVVAAGMLLAVALVVTVNSLGVLPGRAGVALDNLAQLAAGTVAAVCCLITARGTTGAGRAWRRLIGAGMIGWSLGQVVWTVHQLFGGGYLPGPAPAELGYMALPVFALWALLTVTAVSPRRVVGRSRHTRVVAMLDVVIVLGSVVMLSWAPIRAVVQGEGPPGAMVAGVAHLVVDALLGALLGLLLVLRRPPRALRTQLLLLGGGLLALTVSDGFYAYLVATDAERMTPLHSAGWVLGPALIALAALARAPEEPAAERDDLDPVLLLLPVLPVVATGVTIAIRTLIGHPLTWPEVGLGWLGLLLVIVRQLVTIVDNRALLLSVAEARRRLAHQATHDPLTGLANRELFGKRLSAAVDAHREQGRPVALLFVDLDDFKFVNDSFGHAAGDRMLQEIAARLQRCVRRDDMVARLGGDEFAVLLEADPGAPGLVGERILAAVREPVLIDGKQVSVAASVGVVAPEPYDIGLTGDALLRRADAAMYAGKRRGKNIMVRYAGTRDGGGDADLPGLLAEALAAGPADSGFTVHYQPIVDLHGDAVLAVEALARWTHPDLGVIGPDVFVAVAERAGLVAALDDFVLDTAARDARALAELHGRDVALHVNVSAGRLGRPELEIAVADALRRHRLPPERLILEITETRRIADLGAAVAAAGRLAEMGVRLALDDFGTGFNSLAQLHALPVAIVKLDATLTTADDRSRALVRSVLSICRDMGASVIAEGIEDPPQAAALAGLGCPLGQGYLYGAPVPLPS